MNNHYWLETSSNVWLFCLLWYSAILFIETCKFENLPSISNAHVSENRTDSSLGKGTAFTYQCNVGFKVANGSNNAVCLDALNGTLQWTVPTLFCVLEDCNEPPDLFHAKRGKVEAQGPPYPVGSQAKYSCLHGFYKHSGTDTADCIRGSGGQVEWTKPSLDCRAVNCGDPGQVEHAEREGYVFSFPENVTYRCHPGYFTKEKVVLYCLPDGEWSDPRPTCKVVQCPDLEDPSNGLARTPDTIYRSVAVYSCSRGYLLTGDHERHCMGNGTWSGQQPVCKEVRCRLLTDLPGVHIVHGKDKNSPGDLVIMKCRNSDDRRTLKCGDSGEWNTSPLVCHVPTSTPTTTGKPTTIVSSVPTMHAVALKCGDPGPISHGSLVESQREISFPTSANLTFICDGGYELSGSASLHCLPTGQWHPNRLPACEKPTPVSLIIGLVCGLLFLLGLLIVGIIFYKRKRKARGSESRKANSVDAISMEETHDLGKSYKKPIPVTSL